MKKYILFILFIFLGFCSTQENQGLSDFQQKVANKNFQMEANGYKLPANFDEFGNLIFEMKAGTQVYNMIFTYYSSKSDTRAYYTSDSMGATVMAGLEIIDASTIHVYYTRSGAISTKPEDIKWNSDLMHILVEK